MLTGRAKAYSSTYPQAITHRSTNRARRKVTLFQPKRATNYATPPIINVWVKRCVSDEFGWRSGGGDKRATEYRDEDEEFTVERTCTKTIEKITANRKSRLMRHDTKDDADQRVSL